MCRKCSSETENIFSTVLNAGRSIDSSSENLSGKEEEERRSRFPLSLPINTPLLIPRGRVPTAFSIRVERGFSANLSATTPFRIFLSFLFSVRTKKSHRLFIIIVVKSIGSLNYRERKKPRVDRRNCNISVFGSGWHLNSQLSIASTEDDGENLIVTNKVASMIYRSKRPRLYEKWIDCNNIGININK